MVYFFMINHSVIDVLQGGFLFTDTELTKDIRQQIIF